MYPNAGGFGPTRFPKKDKNGAAPMDPASYVFGFRRRLAHSLCCFKSIFLKACSDGICPGLHFADASMFVTVACVLATFNIEKALDENGREIVPEAYTALFITYVAS
jgi:hypothetical protein